MMYNIFLTKESRAGERRVALIPNDVEALVAKGHSVCVENNAGLAAGYKDAAYQAVGASIAKITEASQRSYTDIFKNINMVVRAKRPSRQREKLEYKAVKPGTIMIGALDPFEAGSNHVNEYHSAGILAYSIDQAVLPPTDPMNVLAAMSRFAGELALKDALSKCQNTINKVVIIGLGEVGRSALNEALKQKIPVVVIVGNEEKAKQMASSGAVTYVIDRSLSLHDQQQQICPVISEADIIITTARKSGQQAPLLIPKTSLDVMKPGAVIVDMTISEGGNVYGSKHDETIRTERNVLVTNVSGYPKVMPHEASALWSKASLHFILRLAENADSIALKPC